MALKHVPIDCECILIPATARTIKMTLQACLGREESIYPTCKLLQIELRYFKVDLLKVPGPEEVPYEKHCGLTTLTGANAFVLNHL